MLRHRAGARLWALSLLAMLALLVIAALPAAVPAAAESNTITPPDLYQVAGGAAGVDERGYQTGSPVDPLPIENAAMPESSISGDDTPSTTASAAFIQPAQSAQAISQLYSIPLPDPTEATVSCSGCTSPQHASADGGISPSADGGRLALGAGTASATANLYTATASAGAQTIQVGPIDQVASVFHYAASLAAGAAGKELIPGCGSQPLPSLPGVPGIPSGSLPSLPAAPASALPSLPIPASSLPVPLPNLGSGALPSLPVLPSPGSILCSPTPSVLVSSGSETTTSTISTSSSGTTASTSATLHDSTILGGLISIGAITNGVSAHSDGTASNTAITVTNRIAGVCVESGDCSYQITAQGICKAADSAQACSNDPLNQTLRKAGFNVCRLGSAHSGDGSTTVTGSSEGVLVEFHAQQTSSGGLSPDPNYYSSSDCSPAAPQPKTGFAGDSLYVVLGEASLQLAAQPNPSVGFGTSGNTSGGFAGGGFAQSGGYPGSAGSSTTIVTPGSPGTGTRGTGTFDVMGMRVDRRFLYLSLFGLLTTTLLYNLTMMARSRALVIP